MCVCVCVCERERERERDEKCLFENGTNEKLHFLSHTPTHTLYPFISFFSCRFRLLISICCVKIQHKAVT